MARDCSKKDGLEMCMNLTSLSSSSDEKPDVKSLLIAEEHFVIVVPYDASMAKLV
jgi:hypothetical protein